MAARRRNWHVRRTLAAVAIAAIGLSALVAFVAVPFFANDDQSPHVESPLQCPLPSDASASRMLLREGDMPPWWVEIHLDPIYLPATTSRALEDCARLEPPGRTGYAQMTWWGSSPDTHLRAYTLHETISIFDSDGHASAFVAAQPKTDRSGNPKWKEPGWVATGAGLRFQAGSLSVGPLTAPAYGTENVAYAISYSASKDASDASVFSAVLMIREDNIVWVLRIFADDVPPDSAVVRQFAAKATGKIGSQPAD